MSDRAVNQASDSTSTSGTAREATTPSPPRLRHATPDDAHAIAHLHAASWRHAYRGALSDAYLAGDIDAERTAVWIERLTNPATAQRVLVTDGTPLLGFACVNLRDDATWGTRLDNLHVAPAAHGRGIGAQLMWAVGDLCRAEAPDAGLWLYVLQQNARAIRFYRSHGGVEVGGGLWEAPDGSRSPRFRYAWPVGAWPTRPDAPAR
jgi:ribosomal protein S18 acetylase RimI-like enzyme